MSNAPITAIVAKSSRRFVDVILPDGREVQAMARTKAIETTSGDNVLVEQQSGEWVLIEVLPRQSELVRCYRDERVAIAANVSHVFLIASVTPRLNLTFIDRVLTSTTVANLPTVLIINKVDLGTEDIHKEIALYKLLTDTVLVSAKFEIDLDLVHERMQRPQVSRAALVGMSGAGKSTLLNKIIPGLTRRTADVSERTGFGKQTTTQAEGFWYIGGGKKVFLIDSPGIQNFGVMHLTIEEVSQAMPDIFEAAQACGFDNCSHRSEKDCGVRRAVAEGRVLQSRYDSFCNMCLEIESMKHWERDKRVR